MNMADKYGMEFEHDYFDYQYWEYIDLTKKYINSKRCSCFYECFN